MNTAGSFETLVPTYQSTLLHISKELTFNIHIRENPMYDHEIKFAILYKLSLDRWQLAHHRLVNTNMVLFLI
jgi:hypothetical protein